MSDTDGAQEHAEKKDADLVALALKDSVFFGVLMERYEEKLLRYIRRISALTKEEAEDVLQESFLKAYENLNDFDQRLSFSSWVYRIVHNVTISTWRKNKARPQGNSVDVDERFMENIAVYDVATKEIDHANLQKSIGKILTTMDEKYRTVLVLKYFEEKDYREISDILKKPMGTVATLLSRAKKQFRKECAVHNISFEL